MYKSCKSRFQPPTNWSKHTHSEIMSLKFHISFRRVPSLSLSLTHTHTHKHTLSLLTWGEMLGTLHFEWGVYQSHHWVEDLLTWIQCKNVKRGSVKEERNRSVVGLNDMQSDDLTCEKGLPRLQEQSLLFLLLHYFKILFYSFIWYEANLLLRAKWFK